MTLKDLSTRARLAQSTVTGIVAQMEAGGLLERRRDDEDGRSYWVQLTAKARSLQPRLAELDRRLARVYEAGLSRQEVATLQELLDRFLVTITTSGRLDRRADERAEGHVRGRRPTERGRKSEAR